MPEELLTSTLSFEQTVPCSLAHRRCLGEVFVADTAAVGPGEYLAAIQIPRAHSLWSDRRTDFHDPLAAVEAIRQAMTVLGHRYLGLPLGTALSLQRMTAEIEDHGALRDTGTTPLEGTVRIRTDLGSGSGPGYLADHSFDATLAVAAVPALTVRGGGIAFPPETYAEFRDHQRRNRAEQAMPTEIPAPVAPDRVGRRDMRNVVVGGDLELLVDRRHPSFFDHPYDHVPGPLILEGFRQAALVAAGEPFALGSIEATFTGFAELDGPLIFTYQVDADPDFGADVELALSQSGVRIADCRIELTPYPSDAQN
ncbi:AfsA-related hotdog domain-containing protein [Nocardia anaemiae]|uniref:AfsA-related hotdog domain-containing protein n=1 Tax=Nocardia anaemiae TaxID=263910 RepID=UPI0007A47D24|nr:AfsA-related hotdog domain-containing protein [Nocardia anaemiae]